MISSPAPAFIPNLMKERIELDDIPEDLNMDEDKSNHASNIFKDPEICKWFVDNVVEPREWKLEHPDDAPPNPSKDIMFYDKQFREKGLRLWDIINDPYSSVRLHLVSKTNPTRSANLSGRADYLVTLDGVSRPESLSHVLCVIEQQSGSKKEEECEHQLETYLFLLMNKYGLHKLVGLLVLDDGRCRAYKATHDASNGCLYLSNDTFSIFYITIVVENILKDLGMI
jgi:hypothetical protein